MIPSGFGVFFCKEYSKNTFLSYGEASRFVDVLGVDPLSEEI